MSIYFPTRDWNGGGRAGCLSPIISISPRSSSLTRSFSAAARSSSGESSVRAAASSNACIREQGRAAELGKKPQLAAQPLLLRLFEEQICSLVSLAQ
mmetsp:Transcript_30938/g.54088  ORF Transcript_30938/g.54088 Transcript_30938/m.54088 type:complete len:97 (-) Transcript_30938:1279-1569(-)